MTIASHTGDGAAAVEQLEILTAERVSPAKFVWVHAQNELDHGLHEKVARAGAWVEFDGIGPKTVEFHLECVRFLEAKGLLKRTLVSQDAGWYHVGEPGGGEYVPVRRFSAAAQAGRGSRADVGEPARGFLGLGLLRLDSVRWLLLTKFPSNEDQMFGW